MGNDWNEFMQSKQVRVVLYGVCTCFCAFHAVGAINDLRFPEGSAQLIEAMGSTGFYAMTVVRLLVMLWATIAFARMAIKALREGDQ